MRDAMMTAPRPRFFLAEILPPEASDGAARTVARRFRATHTGEPQNG